MSFIEPYYGCSLVPENALTLIDRGLAVGDVVKRRSSDIESGTVIRTSAECTLQPIYSGALAYEVTPWPYKEEDNWLVRIPGEELKYIEDYNEGDYIIYQGWVGVVMDVYEEVAIRLSNGTVIVVEDADELEVPASVFEWGKKHRNMSLGSVLEECRVASEGNVKTEPAERYYPGLVVTTKKGNLRRGKWKYGVYDPSIDPKGVVVEVRDVQIEVNWITTNVFDMGRNNKSMPAELLDLDDLDSGEIQLYNKGRMAQDVAHPNSNGAVWGSSFAPGEYVRFRDLAGAALKYAASPTVTGRQQGSFHRIPRTSTQGYDMNVFLIKEAKFKTIIQWQDGSTSQEESTSLVPYMNVDDHDVWPGEIVALKCGASDTIRANAMDAPNFIKPKQIGVIQSTDAKERLARVRWFENPDVGIFDEQRSVLLPGSSLGQLSLHENQVSFYEIIAYPALTKRRGDLVLVAPSAQMAALHSAQALEESASNDTIVPATLQVMFGTAMGLLRPSSLDPNGNTTASDVLEIDSRGVDWFGEIVDLGLDGLLTVRLGASSDVKDIRVPVERIIVVTSDDDDTLPGSSSSENDDPESWSDGISTGSTSESNTENVIEEVVEYEGGTRLDADGDEDVWMTDEEDSEPFQVSTSDGLAQIQEPQPVVNAILDHPAIGEIWFSQYSNMKAQFMILESPPPFDHHFLTKTVNLSANLMRRIRYEHSILIASLPDGIWVRTWADRLDLLRILIVGPRSTPYEMAPFVMDFHLSGEFPASPPEAYFHSWTNGVGRINPNLYEDGKICLSLLGTWPGDEKNEGWSAERSSMLQVLISLMGLVLVEEPYYSEYF